MALLHEELEGRDSEPDSIETGLVTSTPGGVNLMEITGDDWELLQSIKRGENQEASPAADWLAECGLLVIKDDSVSLSQFAEDWLSATIPT